VVATTAGGSRGGVPHRRYLLPVDGLRQGSGMAGSTGSYFLDIHLTTQYIGAPLAGFPLAGFPLAGFPLAGFPLAGFPLAGFPLAGFPNRSAL
jgi:hypothetical protein